MHNFEFIIFEHDKCMYSKNFGNKYIILCLYVDNILILETSLDAIQKVKDYLSQNFDMKDQDPADMILGIKISKISDGISLSLAHSIERMLHKFDFYNSKSISTPLRFFNCFEEEYEWACISSEILSIDRFTSLYFQQN